MRILELLQFQFPEATKSMLSHIGQAVTILRVAIIIIIVVVVVVFVIISSWPHFLAVSNFY